jgi:hypothetical protein
MGESISGEETPVERHQADNFDYARCHSDRSPKASWDEVEKSILNGSLHSTFGSSRDDTCL